MTDGEVTGSLWQAHTGVFKDWGKLWKQRQQRRSTKPATVGEAS
jgi:hypothetical protein